MTEDRILKELNFITGRHQWLKKQPKIAGVLTRLDDRLEAGLLIKLIEEREEMLGELQ